MPRRVIITAPPPTSNGDLHVGHLAGPFMALDAFRRYVELRGGEVVAATYSDDNTSYVETTAARLGETASEVSARCNREIKRTMRAGAVELDAYLPADAEHNQFACKFFSELYERGVLKLKEKEFYYAPALNKYIIEAFLSGYCQECFAKTKAGICETCGHPNNYTEILDPHATVDPNTPLVKRSVKVVVFELEPYRDEIRRFFADKWSKWRPHTLQLVNECLENALPDFPVTYPHSWGIPAPFPGCEGQVLNSWAEVLPGLIKSTTAAARGKGLAATVDDLWYRENGWEVVQFFGYDNSYFYVFVNLALLMACGERYVLPSGMVINEFYQLDNSKFSTSLNHVVWARDLLESHGSDFARFYLALSNPSYQKSNFTLNEMTGLVSAKLVEPWQRAVTELNRLKNRIGLVDGTPYDPTTRGARRMATLTRRFERFYEAETMNLRLAAETVTQLLEWIASRARKVADDLDRSERLGHAREASDLLGLLQAAAIVMTPLMPAFGERLRRALAVPATQAWPTPPFADWTIRSLEVPADLLPRPAQASVGRAA